MKRPASLLLAVALLGASSRLAAQAAMYDGRPVFAEGVDQGYYVWRDGDSWHLRWTTKGIMRSFSGAVTAEGGELKSLKRIDVESETKVLYPGRTRRVVVGPRGRVRAVGGRPAVVETRVQDKIEHDGKDRIVFSTKTNDDIDGFDFKVGDKVTGLRFVLEIDGQPRPNFVEVGRNNQKVPGLPLVVRLN